MKRYAAFRDALLTSGVHANSSGLACIFTSTAHTDADLAVTCAAMRKAIRAVA
jgi:glutamate-1-semialdehyde aminotransferase